MLRSSLLAIVLLLVAGSARAQVTPIAVSLFPAVSLPGEDYTVTGLRINLITGYHRSVWGLDLGLVGNFVKHQTVGVQIGGLFNSNYEAYIVGTQLAGLANFNAKSTYVYGIQAAALANVNGAGHMVGLQLAAINLSSEMTVVGVQLGVFNRVKRCVGLQVGLINYADYLHGIQLGLINIHKDGLLPFFPIVNIGI